MDSHHIIEDALDKHFPESDITIFRLQHMNNQFQVGIDQKHFNFAFFIDNNFIQAIQSKYDCFDEVKKLSNFDIPKNLNYVNEFLKHFYEKTIFNKIFESFSEIPDESMYYISKMKELNQTMMHNLSEASISNCRLDKKEYLIYLKSSFKMTKNRELLAVPTLTFFNEKNSDFKFEIAFNIESQKAHLVKSYPIYYDDFFETNKIFNFDTDIDFIFNSFIDNLVMKRIDPNNELSRQLSSLGNDIDTKIKLLLMYSI